MHRDFDISKDLHLTVARRRPPDPGRWSALCIRYCAWSLLVTLDISTVPLDSPNSPPSTRSSIASRSFTFVSPWRPVRPQLALSSPAAEFIGCYECSPYPTVYAAFPALPSRCLHSLQSPSLNWMFSFHLRRLLGVESCGIYYCNIFRCLTTKTTGPCAAKRRKKRDQSQPAA